MPRFVLLDHSLKGIGGHHFDYALHVLRAAQSLGYDPVLASNRRFRGDAKLPRECRVFPLFRYHTYSKYTVFAGTSQRLIDPTPGDGEAASPATVWDRLQKFNRDVRAWVYKLRHKNGPQRRINDFSSSCRKLFSKIGLESGDIAFVPTLSELDLAGLVTYLESEPKSQVVDWHLQFHFNIFDGREPDYIHQQQRFERLKQHFLSTLQRASGHRLHFYNTSEPLTGQYNRLQVASFSELPYPINEEFYTRRLPPAASDKPLRITCAGGVRTEKGQSGLGDIVRELWDDCFAPGKAQLLVQAKASRFTGRPRFEVPLPEGTQGRASQQTHLPTQVSKDPVVYIRHPLGIDDYEDLIRWADIGLLLYDSDRYYSRRAGILGELLASGVPVLVPAGCWLAEQIAEPIYQHVDKLAWELPLVSSLSADDVTWDQTAWHASELALPPGRAAITGACSIPPGSTELVVSHRWILPAQCGTYLRIHAMQCDWNGTPIAQATSIVGRRVDDHAAVPTLVHVHPDAKRLHLQLSNAYDDGPIILGDLQLSFLSAGGSHPRGCPSGAVGLAFAEPGEAPRLLKEMIEHYAHYRRTAAAFCKEWFERHDPRLTVQTLIENSQGRSVRRQAA